MSKHDIETREDCERLVREFYARAFEDEIIGWLFTDIAKLDLEAHVPQITSFWETVLLERRHVPRQPVPAPCRPPREGRAARRALRPLARGAGGTVDDLFEGETAEMAKAHALRVAQAFYRRLQSFPSPADAHQPGLTVTQHGPESA